MVSIKPLLSLGGLDTATFNVLYGTDISLAMGSTSPMALETMRLQMQVAALRSEVVDQMDERQIAYTFIEIQKREIRELKRWALLDFFHFVIGRGILLVLFKMFKDICKFIFVAFWHLDEVCRLSITIFTDFLCTINEIFALD